MPVLKNSENLARKAVTNGAVVLEDTNEETTITLVGTGSEVHLCIEAKEILANEHNIKARVVSMPSLTNFLKLSIDEQKNILGRNNPVISIEAGSTFGWSIIADETIGIDRFGASAPGNTVLENLQISTKELVTRSLKLLSK